LSVRGNYQSDWRELKGHEARLVFEASGGVRGVCELPQMCELPQVCELPQTHELAQVCELPQVCGREPAMEISDEMMDAVDEVSEKKDEAVPENPKQTRNMLEEIRKEREAVTAGRLSENKWEQLCSMYEKVHPVDGNIDFIKIAPEDFVILRQEYQSLVRNSFLLHGYYNYRYILLGKYPDKYYLGVPGIMHEQERMAAAMFGFVGFERAVAQQPDAEERETDDRKNFGYYMMEVAI